MADTMKFNKALNDQFKRMSGSELFEVDVDKNELWDVYLSSFPEGTNPIYKERTEHDCNCCKQFVRDVGGVVAIVNNQLVSLWDVTVDNFYQVVADAMAAYIRTKPIQNVYRHYQKKVGTNHNYQAVEGNKPIRWDHLNLELPVMYVTSDPGSFFSNTQANHDVLKRSLEEISMNAIEIVSELIVQNSIYRGEEHKRTVDTLKRLKKKYDEMNADQRELFIWSTSADLGNVVRFKNTVIGTLLTDISDDVDLEVAVKSFESKVAPQNYKRSSALITQSMIKKAQETVEKLGIEDALHRRYATETDLTINNVLFADRSTKPKMKGVFDELKPTKSTNAPNMNKVEDISIDDFIKKVLPKIDSMEVFFDNKHASNLVSLIAPQFEDAKPILKWDNNFSWSYNGEVTDSIKERVKAAGGNVNADVRVSLSWFNYDDLDLHVAEPDGNTIYFSRKKSIKTGGQLDVDMNAGCGKSREAVENIFWENKSKMIEGRYQVIVHNYSQREKKDVGFEIEMEFDGNIYHFSYPQEVGYGKKIAVVDFNYSKKGGITILKEHVASTSSSKNVWGVDTQQYYKVKLLMNSPNHWDDQQVGNKHWFFMIESCNNPDQARGFYNEFLRNDLNEHRKVFEVLGSKMKTPESTEQLSGLGFSSTKRDQVLCKVSGSFNRVLNIKF